MKLWRKSPGNGNKLATGKRKNDSLLHCTELFLSVSVDSNSCRGKLLRKRDKVEK